MTQFLTIHPQNPQLRLIRQSVDIIRKGGLMAYPTDSSYALGCHIGDKAAMERIRRIRRVDAKHNFTLVCRDLSEIGTYAKVSNAPFRLMKSLTPGPYTFILKATHEVPRRLQNPRRKTIGLRVPDNQIVLALLEALGEPIMSVTLIMPDEEMPENDPEVIHRLLDKQVELIIDGGPCSMEPTTVVDLTNETPQVARYGKGATDMFD
ncbi:MAG: threonylcarbamoyl-AMP synthase [Gammaproteobacteria bacterium]|nr:threonylcarbamoyl-AMP synthase [Gammaproteobacteria bacterium]